MIITIDSATPIVTVAIIAVTFVVLLFVIYKTLSQLKSIKLGPLEAQIEKQNIGNSHLSNMYKEIEAVKKDMRDKIAIKTDELVIKFMNFFSDRRQCSIMRMASVWTIIPIFDRAGFFNNFASLLSKNNISNYKGHIFNKIKDIYDLLHSDSKQIRCTVTEVFLPWADIKDGVLAIEEYWLNQVVLLTIIANLDIRKILKKYETKFHGDQYRLDIVRHELTENKIILEALDRRDHQKTMEVIKNERRRSNSVNSDG